MGVGEAANDKKHLESAVQNMTAIAGQKPVVTKARQSVASFKIREGWPIGCKVTLRGNKMYEFMNSYILLPRRVTLHPIGHPSLILKLATDCLALVTTGFCPAIAVMF